MLGPTSARVSLVLALGGFSLPLFNALRGLVCRLRMDKVACLWRLLVVRVELTQETVQYVWRLGPPRWTCRPDRIVDLYLVKNIFRALPRSWSSSPAQAA